MPPIKVSNKIKFGAIDCMKREENIAIRRISTKSEFFNLVFCFSLWWIEQQTPTPHRPLPVPLNGIFLFFPRICFPPWHNIFRDSTFPSLAEGGLLTKLDNREEIEQVRKTTNHLEKPNAKREKKEETWEIIRRDKKQFSLSQCLKSWWGKTEKNYHESENGLFELVFKSGGSSLWWKMRFLNNLWWVLSLRTHFRTKSLGLIVHYFVFGGSVKGRILAKNLLPNDNRFHIRLFQRNIQTLQPKFGYLG